jgi:hypothetical protein
MKTKPPAVGPSRDHRHCSSLYAGRLHIPSACSLPSLFQWRQRSTHSYHLTVRKESPGTHCVRVTRDISFCKKSVDAIPRKTTDCRTGKSDAVRTSAHRKSPGAVSGAVQKPKHKPAGQWATIVPRVLNTHQTNSVASSPHANYTD